MALMQNLGFQTSINLRIQESGVRMFEKLVNYQIGIFDFSLKKLTDDS